ncbi:hypothetical protein ACHAQA_001433 [Verticillium albo-atrum]
MLFTQILKLASAATIFPVVLALELPNYEALKTSLDSGVLHVTFHNPEWPTVNFWGKNTQDDLTDLVERLQVDNDTKVVIFNSDVPRFYIAHLDTAILAEPNGRGGGGQFLTHLIGRGRAMEYILAAKDITAAEAERIGWINKAFETSSDMYAYIEVLTSRIRLFPLNSLGEAKTAINRASAPSFEDVYAEAEAFSRVVVDPLVQRIQAKSAEVFATMDLVDAELNLAELAPKFYE